MDPAIEGPGSVQEEDASVAVTRERRPPKSRRTRPASAATAVAEPALAAVDADASPATDDATDQPAAGDPITAEVPVTTPDLQDNGAEAPSPV